MASAGRQPAGRCRGKSRLVTSTWDVVNGRRRRVYTLTDRGRAQLQREHATWNEFAGAIQSVLKGVSWPEPA